MTKKRGKTTKRSAKGIKKAISNKRQLKLSEEKPLKGALHELEILAEERKVEHKVEDVEKREEAIEQKESAIINEEKNIERKTEEVERLEKEIKREVSTKPLTAFKVNDLNKAIIGAFIGVVAHFGFIYGKLIAENISAARATLLIVFSYLLIIILMYETGYREIKEKRLLGIFPKRATAVYFTSLVMVIVIFFMFNFLDISDPIGLYKEIAVTSVLASVGAGTADLIGRA